MKSTFFIINLRDTKKMLFFVQFFISQVIAKVTVLKTTPFIYDISPELHIRGSGFDVEARDITLQVNADGQSPLLAEQDFILSKDPEGKGLMLKLLKDRQWADLNSLMPPLSLILWSVKFKGSNRNLIPAPITIAHVLKTPIIRESTQYIFSTSKELIINGTGFIGSNFVNFDFQPPLVKGVAYEDVTKYPQKDQIVLRLRRGYTWREDEGPLKIIGVDTGGGTVKVGGEEGVVIANIVTNPELPRVIVHSTVGEQFIYADEANVVIRGLGFNSLGNSLRFTNGLAGGRDFTTVSTSDSMISLRIVPGALWRKDFENLPGPLTVLAMNVGNGFVPVYPNSFGKGTDVALVFERPDVFSNGKSIYRTQTHEFYIKGTGFPSSFKPMLKFDPPLIEGVDYALRVVNRTDLKVTLLEGKAWFPYLRGHKISLFVTAINGRGDDAGWVKFRGEGVRVAEVLKDVGNEETNTEANSL